MPKRLRTKHHLDLVGHSGPMRKKSRTADYSDLDTNYGDTQKEFKFQPFLHMEKIEQNITGFHVLKDDCIREILDWLSIVDLYAVSLTCKRLHQLSKEHFQRTYKRAKTVVEEKNGVTRIVAMKRKKHYQRFKSLVHSITIPYNLLRNTSNILTNFDRNIKELYFERKILTDWTDDTVTEELNSKFLENVEKISVDWYFNEIFQNVLKHCPKIKYLRLCYQGCYHLEFSAQSGVWPTIKYLAYHSYISCDLDNLLDRLPNVTSLSVYYKYSVKWLLQSERRFDDLTICIDEFFFKEKETKQVFDELQMLLEKKVTKRLHLFLTPKFLMYGEKCSKMGMESLALEVDYVWKDRQDKFINSIARETNLKMLLFKNRTGLKPRYNELLAKKLVNLEELYFSLSMNWIEIIMPFIRHSPKLKIIHIRHHSDDSMSFPSPKFKTTLQDLHNERQKLEAASKLSIFLREDHFLHMKLNSLGSSYGLVNIKRTAAYASNNPFLIFENDCIYSRESNM